MFFLVCNKIYVRDVINAICIAFYGVFMVYRRNHHHKTLEKLSVKQLYQNATKYQHMTFKVIRKVN